LLLSRFRRTEDQIILDRALGRIGVEMGFNTIGVAAQRYRSNTTAPPDFLIGRRARGQTTHECSYYGRSASALPSEGQSTLNLTLPLSERESLLIRESLSRCLRHSKVHAFQCDEHQQHCRSNQEQQPKAVRVHPRAPRFESCQPPSTHGRSGREYALGAAPVPMATPELRPW
jgi:hypothetical protein